MLRTGNFFFWFACIIAASELVHGLQTNPNAGKEYEINALVDFINDGINKSINPCDDFYKYVCSSHSSASDNLIEKHFYESIRPFIESDTKYPIISKALLTYVDDCSLMWQNETYRKLTYQNFLKSYGFFPLLGETANGDTNFWKGFIRAVLLADNGMIEVQSAFVSDKNELKIVPFVSASEQYNANFEKLWRGYLTTFSIQNGSSIVEEKKKMDEFVMKYRKVIAEFHKNVGSSNDSKPLGALRDKKLRKAMYELVPYFLDAKVNIFGLKLKISEEFVENMSKLFTDYPIEGQHFVHVMAIASNYQHLVSTAKISEGDSGHECFFTAVGHKRFKIFDLYVANLAVRNNFSMTTVDDQLSARETIEDIRQEIRRKLLATSWLRGSRDLLRNLEHLMIIGKAIAFSEFMYDDKNFADELNQFSSQEDSFLAIAERARISNFRIYFNMLITYSDYRDPFVINAFNSGNLVGFYFLTLSSPFYATHFPESYNLGFLGSIVGHEYFHSFAPPFTLDSNYQLAAYNESLSCYEKFYNEKMCFNLTVKEKEVDKLQRICSDGANDLMENMPDVEGARVAFNALKRKLGSAEKLKNKPLADHFDFTHEQLFFIARAQLFCDNRFNNDTHFANKIQDSADVHAAFVVRVNAVAMQMSEFAEAFSCKPTDAMFIGEEEKCDLLPSN